jgi:hypothetical protein
VSPKTRLEFREYFVGTSVARVDDAFTIARIPCREDFQPQTGGARRSRVEQYYASLNFSKWADIKRLLAVYEHVLDEVEQQLKHGDPHAKKYAERELDTLLRCVRRDGFDWVGGRLVSKSTQTHLRDIQDAITSLAAPELPRQLERLREAVDDDPALAIGTAKEMLETACKTILEEHGTTVPADWDARTAQRNSEAVEAPTGRYSGRSTRGRDDQETFGQSRAAWARARGTAQSLRQWPRAVWSCQGPLCAARAAGSRGCQYARPVPV